MATQRLESPSSKPGYIDVFVQAGSFEACQSIIFQVMDEAGNAEFTLPVQGADGDFYAVGHYEAPTQEPLPEFP